VSATTRAPRPGERAGDHYDFVSEDRFRAMIEAGEFLEWAEIYGRHLSGTPRAPVEEALAAGRDVILELDIQGAAAIKQAIPEAVLVFVEPPSMEVLADRLRARGTEDPEALARRMEVGYEEVKARRNYDHMIVNEQLEAAVGDFLRILDVNGTARKD
jgi:guanylate kinase